MRCFFLRSEGPAWLITEFHTAPKPKKFSAAPALEERKRFLSLDFFWKGLRGKYSTLHFHEKKLTKNGHAQRCQKWRIFELGRTLFIAQNKKVWFDFPKWILEVVSQINRRSKSKRNLFQASDSSWNSQLLSRLTERSHGLTLAGILVCSALGGPPPLSPILVSNPKLFLEGRMLYLHARQKGKFFGGTRESCFTLKFLID